MSTAVRWLVVLAAIGVGIAGAVAIVGQMASGQQPWDPELSDNFVFVKAIPFVFGLGIAVGLLRRRAGGLERRGDKTRRFSPGTIAGHWIATIGFLLAMPTGMWQYLGGILDVHADIPLFWFYRIHYVGGAIILFSVANFLTYWWVSGDRSLLPPRGEWRAHLAGFARDLPRWLAARLAGPLRLDLSQRLAAPSRFTYYETAWSFPTWTIAIALITITGIIKAMRYVYPIPGTILYWSSTLHVLAMVLIVLKVLDHLRYTFARWPMMVAMAKGWVPEGALRRVLERGATPPPAREPAAPRTPAGVISGSDT